MMNKYNHDSHDPIMRSIHLHHKIAKTNASYLRSQQSFLAWLALIAVITSTILAFTAVIINDSATQGKWKFICGTVGGLNAVAGTCAVIAKRRDLDKRLAHAETCEGDLNALLLACCAGTTNREDLVKEYRQIVKRNPTILKVDQDGKAI